MRSWRRGDVRMAPACWDHEGMGRVFQFLKHDEKSPSAPRPPNSRRHFVGAGTKKLKMPRCVVLILGASCLRDRRAFKLVGWEVGWVEFKKQPDFGLEIWHQMRGAILHAPKVLLPASHHRRELPVPVFHIMRKIIDSKVALA